ncbi:MAG: ShlB/FhaC/HecB family hemolysin secretion/activation protein [Leptothrix sp. (in: b-proteobacteria)]
MQALKGPTVTVKAFRFKGNTLLGNERLAPAVASYLDRALSFAELQNAAAAVAAVYREAGWVVRVYLPQQDISGGEVTLQVIEAVFGAVRVEGQPQRVRAAQIQAIVTAAQATGAPVNANALDRALLLVGDLSGISTTGRLGEGQNDFETDLVLTVADTTRFGGEATLDNAGSRSTGRSRLSANLALNSPAQRGDLASANLMHTQGSDYLRGAYSLPVGSQGWRVGVNASTLNYHVVTSEFAALDAHGRSSTTGVEASYPLLRSQLQNLIVNLSFDDKRFDNLSGGVTTTKYKAQAFGLSLNGNRFDDLGGGGANTASVGLVQGSIDLTGSPNEAAVAASTRAAGSFSKLRYSASRQQVLSNDVSLYASLSGQLASKNLDSSEKFYLGGANGVRAYPASEGGGSEGRLLTIEARTRLPRNLSLTGFFDWGSVRQNKDNNIAGASANNSYSLKGVGLSLGWTSSFGVSAKASLAQRLGHNPNPTASGLDQDGSLDKTRLWLQVGLAF